MREDEANKDVLDGVAGTLEGELGDLVSSSEVGSDGVLVVRLKGDGYRGAAEQLWEFGLRRLDFITCVDWRDRFTLVLQAYSLERRVAVRIEADIDRAQAVAPTVSDLWYLANWEERECYDLFGVEFEGHPDLRRILLPEKWEGHPLRKDYVDRLGIERPQYF